MFDRPHLLWLLALAPLAATPGILAMRSGMRLAGAASATLRARCVVALVAMLAGLRIPGRIAAQSVAVVAVLDESRSVSPDQQDWMRGRVEQLKSAMAPSDQLGIVGFGRDARLLAPLTDPRLLGHFGDGADGGATNIAGALTAAESLFAPEADKRIVLLSDGNETEDSAMTRGSRDARGRRANFRRRAAAVGYRENRGHRFLFPGRGPRRSALCIQNRRRKRIAVCRSPRRSSSTATAPQSAANRSS